MLKNYNYNDCKLVVTPLYFSVHLFPVNNGNDVINQKEYASIIGSLCYGIDCTRPDIAYAVGILWHSIEHLMKYLSGVKKYGLLYKKNILLCLKDSIMSIGII